MKKYVLAAFLCAQTVHLFANSNEKRVKSEIKEVTVYLSGAQLTNTAKVNLGSGTTQVVFEDLPPYLLENSIQARGEGDFTILSVVKKLNYMDEATVTKEVKLLQDSLETVKDLTELQQTMWKIYDQEEQMMMANKEIGGKTNGVNVAELEKAANLFRSRLTELETKKITLKAQMKKLDLLEEKITAQLDELNSKKQKVSSEVTVTVSANSPVNAKFFLSYTITDAGWNPFYNIRATDNTAPIKLEYLANVWQNSGYEWKDVKLTLATSNPALSGSKPNMAMWWIYYPYTLSVTDANGATGWDYSISPNGDGVNDEFKPIDQIINTSKRMEKNKNVSDSTTIFSNTTANYTRISENQVNTTFDISLPYTIPSDRKNYAVDVQTYNVPAMYRYYCVPKIDKDAFLLARVTGWDQYNLLTGVANIFYEGMYVGRSMINTQNTSDTLDISLGRDKNVVVERVKLKDYSSKKLIANSMRETYMYEFTLRDKKKQDIEIDIEDQVPVSQVKEIEVELNEAGGGVYNKTTGTLTWNFKLTSGDSKKFKFGFSIKFPKDKTIANLDS